ncbi:MAG: twin-arginine translocase TatA/TatE family subunit [Acidilobaceae archaeon]
MYTAHIGIGPLGLPELLVILLIILLIFGATKLPELARALGQSVKEFRKSLSEESTEKQAEKPTREEKSSKSSEA